MFLYRHTYQCAVFAIFFCFWIYNRGSAIAKIVGKNAAELPDFNDRVTMYVFEEMIEGKKLTEIINETHENVKYLPGHKLPANVVSCTMYMKRRHSNSQSETINSTVHVRSR